MLTIIFNGHKITGEVKDIYEFIKLAESEVVSEKNDEVDLGENDERWSTYYTTEPIEKMDEETADRIKGMKDFYQGLSEGERDLVSNIISLKDKDSELDIESVDYVGAYDSEHSEGQWLRFIISYYAWHDRYLEVNYKTKKFVYFKINEGLSVENLRLTAELNDCLLGYEQETVGKWWKK